MTEYEIVIIGFGKAGKTLAAAAGKEGLNKWPSHSRSFTGESSGPTIL